jgi:type I restriction enzyme S subunit
MNTDAAVPGLNRENVYRLKVSLPSGGLLELFDEHVSLLREKIFTATEESRGVSAIRDSLLPKLMTGTLKIERESA